MKIAALVLVTGTAAAASAQTINITLSGLNEIPAVITSATGNAQLTYNAATTQLSWVVTFSGLNNGNNVVSVSHIHAAAGPGLNGPVVIDFADFGPLVSGLSGSTFVNTLSPAAQAGLANGGGYVNVHSARNPGGELRGNIPAGFIPTPAAAALLGLGGLVATRRRR